MGRPPRLCPLCPESHSRNGYSIETCAACDGFFCQRHITAFVKDDGITWICLRCKKDGREPKQLLRVVKRTFEDIPKPVQHPTAYSESPARRRLTCQVCPSSRRAADAEHLCASCGRWVCDSHSTVKVTASRESASRCCRPCAERD